MKVIVLCCLIWILSCPTNKVVNSQILSFNDKRYRKCLYNGLTFPFYPCIKSNINPKTKACKGQINSLANCLDCKERKNKLPYPRNIPPCNTECSSEKTWCEPQQKCIHQDQACDCGQDHTFCTYIDNDKIEHIEGRDVRVRGTTEKYRCLSSKDLESKKNKHEFKICPDGSCKETFMNCSRSTTEESRFATGESSSSLGLATIIPVAVFLALFIGVAIVGVFILYKRSNRCSKKNMQSPTLIVDKDQELSNQLCLQSSDPDSQELSNQLSLQSSAPDSQELGNQLSLQSVTPDRIAQAPKSKVEILNLVKNETLVDSSTHISNSSLQAARDAFIGNQKVEIDDSNETTLENVSLNVQGGSAFIGNKQVTLNVYNIYNKKETAQEN